ncbi:MAG TPA: glycosyltransferase family 9 protein [Caulobacteraceae bacterium]|nr:glycosyltransferase family 9 protein [Caulobacteraceae bacterium]
MSRKSREIRKILVIKLGALGDFVQALAAMQHIREAHPEAHITLLTTPPFEALARASPYFNAVEPDGRPGGIGETLSLIRRLRGAGYDRVYDLQTSSRSSFYFQMLRPFPPQWSGVAFGCSLPQRNRDRGKMHTLERQAQQLKDAGIWPDAPLTSGSAPPADLSWILKKTGAARPMNSGAAPRPYALLVPGASAHRPEKRWPVDRFAELGQYLRERGLDILIVGGPQESALAMTIQRKVLARDLTGRTDFAQIAALGARAALAVGNDTGPIHLIAAAGAPTLVLFSAASDPTLCGPRGHVAVLQAENLDELPVSDAIAAVNRLVPSMPNDALRRLPGLDRR